MTAAGTTVDEEEIAKFEAMADEWWDEGGKFRPLHKFNPVRIGYIRDRVLEYFEGLDKEGRAPLSGLKILDIGCGGGLLAEPMARLGAGVTGIDASEKNINIASIHAEKEGLDIEYICTSAEEFAESTNQYDIVLAMEIVEHVADVAVFIEAASALVKPDGLLFMATLNRTAKSFALAIVGAEYILRWLPRGTHDWKKFLRPSELEQHFSANNMELEQIQGVTYNPLKDLWSLSDDIKVNYMMLAQKPGSPPSI